MGLGKLFTLHTEITFADETTDEIFLKPDPENDCFYHGALKGDIESEVEVDGCKNDAEIVQISSRLVPWVLVILLHKETFTIIPLEGTLGSNNVCTARMQPGSTEHLGKETFPQNAVAKIHVRYDEDLLGSEVSARKKVKAIVDLSRIWFRRYRGLSMDIQIDVIST